jgi:alpha-ketoglutarate-dependent taurine dioxygenase
MAVITTEKLGATVGAEVNGVDNERLLHDDDLPAACLEALEANGALVFRDLHIDDATQVACSRKLGEVEVFGRGEFPEIFRVTLDPAKNPSAAEVREQGLLGEGVDHHASLTPVRRVGRPEDIAAMCSFLVHDEASYVTGQVLGVNGGRNT